MDGQKIHLARIKASHHHKPYLLRHLSLLLAGAWLFFVGMLGFVIGRLPSGQTPEVLSMQSVALAERPVFTSDTFSFSYDPTQVRVSEQQNNIQIHLKNGADSVLASARLTLYTADEPGQTTENLDSAILLNSEDEQIAGTNFKRNTYQHTTIIADQSYYSYSIEWLGEKDSKRVGLRLQGLHAPNAIPAAHSTVLSSLSLTHAGQVLGATQALPVDYVTDAVSPGVVKIYRITCGILMLEGKPIGGEHCDAAAGSGFFVSSEGYIATSGHVVSREAEDVLIDALLDNPRSLGNFLRYLGLSDQQITTVSTQPELLAAVIARLYDAPEEIVSFKDKRERLLVSLGSRALTFDSEDQARKLLDTQDTDHIKQAELVAINYSAKDLFVLAAGDEEGFSASDVALIKVNAKNTPYLEIFTGQVTQNQKITIVGFPGDADNILTDNNSLAVTATNGSIGAIRAAAGSRYKLYQSDADASQGNSGGPVISETGQVLGLLTYRYKNAAASDAAKSYIRDIADLKELADDENIPLSSSGTTQDSWMRGLELFSENRFTKATAEFNKVKSAYPAHRLVASYLQASEKGIADGQDVKDTPVIVAAGVSFIGASGAAGAVVLIARHHTNHLAYKLATTTKTFRPHHARS